MLRILVTFIFSLLCIVANGRECNTIRDYPTAKESGLKIETINNLTKEALNERKHNDETVERIREIIKNDNLPPDKLKYYLFTSENLKNRYAITRTKGSLTNVPFDNKKPLAFGILGFITIHNLAMLLPGDLIRSVVGLNKYNAIFVDYAFGKYGFSSIETDYFLAAKDMAKFLQFIMDETGIKPHQIHLIGVSLGGQLAGIVGYFLPNIGRITGLDPAGSIFNNFPKDLRLDRSDANFVDVIHTCDGEPYPKGMGFYKPCGHLDFYLNGAFFQPGCNSTIPIEQTPTTTDEFEARLCMHDRSALYYMESTCSNCLFVGTMCESYEKFQKGLCNSSNSETAVMGEYATKPIIDLPEDTMFFLNTNDHYPFCKSQQSVNSDSKTSFSVNTYLWSLLRGN